MANEYCPEVALGRVQRVWFTFSDKAEASLNKVTFPLASDLIRPTGDVVVNQTTPTQDSLEKSNTLDVTNVHQGIADIASATVPMYIYTKDYSSAIEGDKLLTALMGKVIPADTITAEVKTGITADDTTIVVDSILGGTLPKRGVIEISDATNTELVLYESYTETDNITGEFTLYNCTRGYGDVLTKNAFVAGSDIVFKSRTYKLDICRQDGCLWVQTDTLLKAIASCRVTECSIPVDVNGGVMPTFTINGKRMYSAGRSDLKVIANVGDKSVAVEDARAFFEGQKIQNLTNSDNNANSGYTVVAVNEETNVITIVEPLAKAWAVDDVVSWWMPESIEHLSEEMMNRDTTILMDGQRALLRSGSLTIGTPVTPIQLVGDRYPGVMVDAVRNITANVSQIMMTDAAIKIREGFDGKEIRLDFEYGSDIGHKMTVVMPRAKLTAATENFQDPTVFLDSDARALGTLGEDSIEIILE